MDTEGIQSKKVFIGNIPFDVTEEELIELFEMIGPVVDLNIPNSREVSGKGRGYAFCEFPDHLFALSAIKNLNGTELKKRQIRVNYTHHETVNPEEVDKNIETSLENLTLQEKFFLIL